jgi:4-hydroxythreonine-4-phosphate dehydrogenase
MSSLTSTTRPDALPLGLTQGDPAGIGPEIILQAFATQPTRMRGCLVVGDRAVFERAMSWVPLAGTQGHHGPAVSLFPVDDPQQALACPPGLIPFMQIGPVGAGCVPLGQVSAAAGRLAADAVTWAARAALHGQLAGIITAPLNKLALSAAEVPFPGHTELLQAEAAKHMGCRLEDLPVRMMLANDELRTVLVSIHLSLREAIEAVTHEQVLQTLRITHASESRLLGRTPRIGVAGLNPHAGEGGLMGREEIDIIAPAIAAARAEGIWASGPHAPDTVFMRARRRPDRDAEFDVVLAMYHDQGLIPVKYLGVEHGVNVTLGLPLVRTSPDHGTAFDLAGTGRADPSSLIQAVHMARALTGETRE